MAKIMKPGSYERQIEEVCLVKVCLLTDSFGIIIPTSQDC